MRNIRFTVSTVDGGAQDFHEARCGRDLIQSLISDDWAAPPSVMRIEATTDDGRIVRIGISYDEDDSVSVTVREATPDDMPYQPGDTIKHLVANATGTVKSCGLNGPVIVNVAGATQTWALDETARTSRR